MRVTDRATGEILVGRDPASSAVEVRIEGTCDHETRVIYLSRDEARRLAALVLFQAAKLGQPRTGWILPYPGHARKSA